MESILTENQELREQVNSLKVSLDSCRKQLKSTRSELEDKLLAQKSKLTRKMQRRQEALELQLAESSGALESLMARNKRERQVQRNLYEKKIESMTAKLATQSALLDNFKNKNMVFSEIIQSQRNDDFSAQTKINEMKAQLKDIKYRYLTESVDRKNEQIKEKMSRRWQPALNLQLKHSNVQGYFSTREGESKSQIYWKGFKVPEMVHENKAIDEYFVNQMETLKTEENCLDESSRVFSTGLFSSRLNYSTKEKDEVSMIKFINSKRKNQKVNKALGVVALFDKRH
jgi:hypothetical protein